MVEKRLMDPCGQLDHTCGRRDVVDECGDQPEGQPNRLAMTTGVGETQSLAEKAEGEKWRWRKGEGQTRRRSESTLHLVIHLPDTGNATATTTSNSNNCNNRQQQQQPLQCKQCKQCKQCTCSDCHADDRR